MIDDEREKRKTGQEKGIGNARTLGNIYCAEAAKAVKVGEATFIGGFVKRTSRRTTGALNRKF